MDRQKTGQYGYPPPFQIMKTLPSDLFNKYRSNPLDLDEQVRKFCLLRDDRYYTVSVWPEHLVGRVYQTDNVRTVKTKKISKSDQKE